MSSVRELGLDSSDSSLGPVFSATAEAVAEAGVA